MQPPQSPPPSSPPASLPPADPAPVTEVSGVAAGAAEATDAVSSPDTDPSLSPLGLDTADTSDASDASDTSVAPIAAVTVNPVIPLTDAPDAAPSPATASPSGALPLAADTDDTDIAIVEEDVAPPYFTYPPSDLAYDDPARVGADFAPVRPPGEATAFAPGAVPAGAATPIPAAPIAARRTAPRFAAPQLHMLLTRLAVAGVSIAAAVGLWLLGDAAHRLADDAFSYAFLTREGWRFWLPGLLLAALTGTLVWLVAGRRASPGLVPATAWIFPFVTMIAGLLIVSVYHDRSWWVVAPVVTAIALVVGTVARTLLHDPSGTGHDIARTALTVTSYVVAFLALAMVYINKLRSIQSATAVALLCILLLLQITDGEPVPLARRLVYALAGGLIVGQVTWVINYWSAPGWTGGAFLLAVFYLVAGLSAAQLRGRIGRFEMVEFGGFALFAMLFVSAAVLLQS